MPSIEKLVRLGFIVLTPHVRYRTSLRGTFVDEGDAFDPALHRVMVRVSPGARLRQALRDVPVEKVRAAVPRPWPETYIDGTSGEHNGVVTPGGTGRLLGTNLQYDPADPLQGVFFVDAAKVETRVEALIWDMPGHLIFTVPTLAAGEYALHVRAILRGTHDMRAGVLDAVLTVAKGTPSPDRRGRGRPTWLPPPGARGKPRAPTFMPLGAATIATGGL